MKPYSIDFRKKVVKAYEQGKTSIRKLATWFDMSKSFVQKLLKQNKILGHVKPEIQGISIKSQLEGYSTQLAQMVKNIQMPLSAEYCEYWGETYEQWVSTLFYVPKIEKSATDA